jgi:hypothetical protein
MLMRSLLPVCQTSYNRGAHAMREATARRYAFTQRGGVSDFFLTT